MFPPRNSARIDIRINGHSYTLHVESPQYKDSGVAFQSHIDVGNPNHFGGAFVHVFVDGLGGALVHPHDAGLDPSQ